MLKPYLNRSIVETPEFSSYIGNTGVKDSKGIATDMRYHPIRG
jgi:hypothetical protein